MKKYTISVLLIIIIGSLIYLSSIYLLKAENSFKQLAQNTEELENQNVKEPPVQTAIEPAKPQQEIKPADVASITITAPKPIEKETEPSGPPKARLDTDGPPLISMDFVNANLKDVLKIFCQQSKLNFIAGENVELKPITLYLNNVSVDDALSSIISANGLRYERAEGSNVFIVRKTVEPETKLETKIFKLNYAFADDQTITDTGEQTKTVKGIKEVIQKLLTPNGDLSVDMRTNSLIITDLASRFKLIEKSIKDLDSQLAQILIEAKVVELTTNDLSQLGLRWSSLSNYTFGLHSPTRAYNENRTSGDSHTDEYTTETINNRKDELVYSVIGGTSSDTTTIDTETNLGRNLTDTLTRTLTRGDLRSAILSADDFTVTLSLLLTDKNTDVISSPNIVTTNGKEAKITIGDKFPIPSYAYDSDTNTWEVQGFEYKDIGILLRVIPYAVKEENNVSLDIHPEVSTISGYSNFGGAGGAKIPIISTREATTNVIIRDGDTLAIGGLLKNTDEDTVTKVPILGDIPIIGNLFKHTEKGKIKTNLVIFITPHILQDGRIPPGAVSEATIPIPMASLAQEEAVNPVREPHPLTGAQGSSPQTSSPSFSNGVNTQSAQSYGVTAKAQPAVNKKDAANQNTNAKTNYKFTSRQNGK